MFLLRKKKVQRNLLNPSLALGQKTAIGVTLIHLLINISLFRGGPLEKLWGGGGGGGHEYFLGLIGVHEFVFV